MYQEYEEKVAVQAAVRQNQVAKKEFPEMKYIANNGYAFESIRKELRVNSPVQLKNVTSKGEHQGIVQRYNYKHQQFVEFGVYYQYMQGNRQQDRNRVDRLDYYVKEIYDVFGIRLDELEHYNISKCANFKEIFSCIMKQVVDGLGIYTAFAKIIDKYNLWPMIELYKCHHKYNPDDKLGLVKTEEFDIGYEFLSSYSTKLRPIMEQLVYKHYSQRRDDKPISEEEPIDPADIRETFDQSKSCVITALFNAEKEYGNAPFGASDVRELHNILVGVFNRNEYWEREDANEHQKNLVWKNYSDDNVYPSLYSNFKYIYHQVADRPNLSTWINQGHTEYNNGIMLIEEHALYFYKKEGKMYYKDNEGSGLLRDNSYKQRKVVGIWTK